MDINFRHLKEDFEVILTCLRLLFRGLATDIEADEKRQNVELSILLTGKGEHITLLQMITSREGK